MFPRPVWADRRQVQVQRAPTAEQGHGAAWNQPPKKSVAQVTVAEFARIPIKRRPEFWRIPLYRDTAQGRSDLRRLLPGLNRPMMRMGVEGKPTSDVSRRSTNCLPRPARSAIIQEMFPLVGLIRI